MASEDVSLIYKPAEGKIVIPRNHGHLSVFFIQVIIVYHGACIAVKIADKIMNGKTRQNSVPMRSLKQVLIL